MKKSKRKILRMSQEDEELLQSLSVRFNISQSEVIRKALLIFAAKTKHNITLCYREPIRKTKDYDEINISSDEPMSEEQLKETIRIAKIKWIKE